MDRDPRVERVLMTAAIGKGEGVVSCRSFWLLERVYNPSVSYFKSLRGVILILSFLSCQFVFPCQRLNCKSFEISIAIRIVGVIFPVHGLFLEVPSRCRHFLHCTNAGMRARQDDTKN